ncbi:MAG: tetratricopeptide repeat protein, partial [Candidatus Omnitrophota bacterium]
MKRLAVVFFALLILTPLNAIATEMQDLTFAEKAFGDELYDIASKKFLRFLEEYPQSQYEAKVHLLLGQCYYHLENYPLAVYEFEAAVSAPTSEFRDAATYWLGEVNFKQSKYDEAILQYDKVLEAFPRSDYAQYALYSMGWCYFQKND